MISSRSNPLVSEYRRTHRDRRAGDRVILLDGQHLIRDALDAGIRIRSAAFLESGLSDAERDALARELINAGASIARVTARVMRAMSPVTSPTGVVALAELTTSDTARLFDDTNALVLAAVDVQDPGNVGALIRAAEAAGATGVAVCGTSADPFSWKALRGSMGSAFRIPIVAGADVQVVIAAARSRRVQVLATQARGGRSPYELDLTKPILVLLGSEGSGLPGGVTEVADERVAIPMTGPVESLNVAVAGAVLAFEALRQRRSAVPARQHRSAR